MRILKPGHLLEAACRGVCKRCRCEFEARREEVYYDRLLESPEFPEGLGCRCPVCGEIVQVTPMSRPHP